MKRVLAISALVVIVSLILGVRVGHPQAGLQSAMGSAKSSLVVYRDVNQVVPGDKVLVVVKNQGLQLGIVKSARAATVDVDTNVSFVRVKQSEIAGKLIAVVPFFGLPFSWIGL